MNLVVKRVAFSVGVVLIAIYGYFTLSGPRGIPGVMDKRHEIRQLQEKNADLAREIAIKRERIRKLTLSESEQGLQIRRDTQKVQEGDTEFMLPNHPKPEPPAPPNE
jgi:cell division protein FtsB